jgi:hypothetical protein
VSTVLVSLIRVLVLTVLVSLIRVRY